MISKEDIELLRTMTENELEYNDEWGVTSNGGVWSYYDYTYYAYIKDNKVYVLGNRKTKKLK